MNKFSIINYTGIQKTLKTSDDFLLRAWEIFCEKHHSKSNIEIIRALLKIENKTNVYGLSAANAFALEWDVEPPCDGSYLFPEEYQPWERCGKVLCDRNSDGTFSLTDHGAMIKDSLMSEVAKHYEIELSILGKNKYQLPLEI